MDRKDERKIRELMEVLRPIQKRLIKKYGKDVLKPRIAKANQQTSDFADEMDKVLG